ncbi:Fc.00g011420.m01.CDS01 [Cosmosporella sp. VM-42]
MAALSLAANILQVLDYGKRFVFTAWDIYQAGTESVKLLSDLHDGSHYFQSVLGELQSGAARASDPHSSKSDDAIYSLGDNCAETLQEILESLATIGSPGKGRKRKAVVTAFKLSWKRSDIESLQDRLNQFRDNLNIAVVISLKCVPRISSVQACMAKLWTFFRTTSRLT